MDYSFSVASSGYPHLSLNDFLSVVIDWSLLEQQPRSFSSAVMRSVFVTAKFQEERS
jgi:hypothetical protein